MARILLLTLLPSIPRYVGGGLLTMLSQYANGTPMMNVAMIELTDGTVALIDADDLALVSRYEWQLPTTNRHSGQHPVGQRPGRDWQFDPVYLHRLIAKAGPEDTVLHRNHDTLDNRRENLVVVARQVLHTGLPQADYSGCNWSAATAAD